MSFGKTRIISSRQTVFFNSITIAIGFNVSTTSLVAFSPFSAAARSENISGFFAVQVDNRGTYVFDDERRSNESMCDAKTAESNENQIEWGSENKKLSCMTLSDSFCMRFRASSLHCPPVSGHSFVSLCRWTSPSSVGAFFIVTSRRRRCSMLFFSMFLCCVASSVCGHWRRRHLPWLRTSHEKKKRNRILNFVEYFRDTIFDWVIDRCVRFCSPLSIDILVSVDSPNEKVKYEKECEHVWAYHKWRHFDCFQQLISWSDRFWWKNSFDDSRTNTIFPMWKRHQFLCVCACMRNGFQNQIDEYRWRR